MCPHINGSKNTSVLILSPSNTVETLGLKKKKKDELHERLEGKRELENCRCPEEEHERRSSEEWEGKKKRHKELRRY